MSVTLKAQNIDSVLNYYPLDINNYWEYEISEWIGPGQYDYRYISLIISSDTTMSNEITYFKMIFRTIPDTVTPTIYYERVDSVSSQVFRYYTDEQEEYVLDSLASQIGDVFYGSRFCYPWSNNLTQCFAQYEDTVLNIYTGLKGFVCYFILDSPEYYLAKGIGLYKVVSFPDVTVTLLKYARIKGVDYGNPINVEDDLQKTSFNKYYLSQNYPNPFNPSTKIKFQIPDQVRNDNHFVTLKVYDILGNEIATLVNEEKQSGTYEVEFSIHSDEGRNLTSGIYFYQLKVRGPEINSRQAFIETKKMILLH